MQIFDLILMVSKLIEDMSSQLPATVGNLILNYNSQHGADLFKTEFQFDRNSYALGFYPVDIEVWAYGALRYGYDLDGSTYNGDSVDEQIRRLKHTIEDDNDDAT
jgi:hypothetical protein